MVDRCFFAVNPGIKEFWLATLKGLHPDATLSGLKLYSLSTQGWRKARQPWALRRCPVGAEGINRAELSNCSLGVKSGQQSWCRGRLLSMDRRLRKRTYNKNVSGKPSVQTSQKTDPDSDPDPNADLCTGPPATLNVPCLTRAIRYDSLCHFVMWDWVFLG